MELYPWDGVLVEPALFSIISQECEFSICTHRILAMLQLSWIKLKSKFTKFHGMHTAYWGEKNNTK